MLGAWERNGRRLGERMVEEAGRGRDVVREAGRGVVRRLGEAWLGAGRREWVGGREGRLEVGERRMVRRMGEEC